MNETRSSAAPEDRGDELRWGERRYVGARSAAISHEIRNSLSLINEKSGLIRDLIALAERGRPLDPARLSKLAEDIARLVKRASQTCDHLSLLSHSADHPTRAQRLDELLAFFTALMSLETKRFEATLELVEGDDVTLEVDPVLLQHGLSLCLVSALEAGDRCLRLAPRRVGDEVGVELMTKSASGLVSAPPAELLSVLERLGARLVPGRSDELALLLLQRSAVAGKTTAQVDGEGWNENP